MSPPKPQLFAEGAGHATAAETAGIFGDAASVCDQVRAVLGRHRIHAVSVGSSTGNGDRVTSSFDALVYCPGTAEDDISPALEAAGGAPVVVVLPSGNPRAARKAVIEGAGGVVEESRVEAALVPAIRAVCSRQLCIPPGAFPGAEHPPLSARERQVLGMVVMGFSNGEIARKLYLAESTIKSHLSSAFGKLNVSSRSEAAALILDPNTGIGVGILTIPEGPAGKTTRRRRVLA